MKKQSGWRYMGNNWRWLSLFLILLSFLFMFGFEMDKVGAFAGIAALLCVFMWVGTEAFFTKGSTD
jgi:hypothetical protein